MASLGTACLVVGLAAALYAAVAALYGARSGRREFVVSARRALYCLAGLLLLAFVVLEAAYVRSDFSYVLVQQNSSTDTPTFYKLTAMWSSQEGSLLLWVTLLSLYSSAVLFLTRRRHREIVPYATAVLGGVAAFFLSLMVVFGENPFATQSPAPAEGNGLNPLLRHPAMMIHPPMLYSGYVGFAIPFAFCVGALVRRRTDADWIRSTRRFALVAWTFLGFGIMLGALWSYSELGWGGYWAWDPVENASLMPWLTGTAFLHSIQVQEKRGMLRVWNVSLIAATFVLALLGTFLVRSGILDSIHAFGASTLGKPFLVFIVAVVVGSAALVLSRLDGLRSEARLDSYASREAFFLLNNLVLVALCAVIFWGTFFPLISEALTGEEESVGPPFFNALTTPLAIALVLLAGVGPVLAWRRVTAATLRRSFALPAAIAGVALAVMLVATAAAESVPSLVMFTLVAFLLTVVGQEFWRGARARRIMTGDRWPVALGGLVARNRRRYGGYVVHAGIGILFLGIAASSAFVEQRDSRLRPGETTTFAGYEVTYRQPTASFFDDRSGTGAPITLGAVLDVRKGDRRFTVRPARNFYPGDAQLGPVGQYFEGEATSEVDVRWGLRRDFWASFRPDLERLRPIIDRLDQRLAGRPAAEQLNAAGILAGLYQREREPASFRTLVSPMIAWIWIGGGIAVLGAVAAAWPSSARRRVSSLYAARLGRELSRA
jgi:cytochrome c-type biogenesis protein CcmF